MKRKSLAEILGNILSKVDSSYHNIYVEKITYDSRKVTPGTLFVAVKGFTVDGHDYLEEAQEKGAIAAIVETKLGDLGLPQVVVKNTRQIMARIAANFYLPEVANIRTVGITGTNGKTTTTYLVRSIMEQAGISSGLIGTIAYHIGDESYPSWNTTPESVDLFEMIYSMYSKGQRGCVMEVSSHGLALNRVDSMNFDAAVFTNLSHDHLDFHHDVDSYFSAKKKLFDLLNPKGIAIINIDDKYGEILKKDIEQNTILFGLNSKADVFPKQWASDLYGINMTINTARGDLEINSSLIGQFNVENILAAVSVGLAFNFDLKTIQAGVEKMKSVPGRLEPIKLSKNRIGIIDYSHTPDALKKALQELNKIAKKDLWVIIGCGGDRDRKKRPIMGKIATDYATHVIVTSDNPRTENPDDIITEIMSGITDKHKVFVEADRKKSIQIALDNTNKNDIILIAGKGHETYQEIQGIKYPFDDKQVILELDQ